MIHTVAPEDRSGLEIARLLYQADQQDLGLAVAGPGRQERGDPAYSLRRDITLRAAAWAAWLERGEGVGGFDRSNAAYWLDVEFCVE